MRSENVDYVSCATDLPTVASGYTDELDDLLPGDDIVVEVVDVRVWDGAALAST